VPRAHLPLGLGLTPDAFAILSRRPERMPEQRDVFVDRFAWVGLGQFLDN